ncbi:hypothetical protein D3C86_1726810 [compost metagenome]
MNQTQIKYVRGRIEEIYAENQKKLATKYAGPRLSMSLQEKIEAIKESKFDIGQAKTLDSLLFHALKDEDAAARNEAHKKAQAELVLAKRALLDELLLGEAEQALEALSNFSKFVN